MRFIGLFFRALWDIARTGNKVNYGRGPGVFFTFLFLFFVVFGLVLVALGFDLQKVDFWLSAHNSWLSVAGDILWRVFCAFVLLMCGLTIWGLVSAMRVQPQQSLPSKNISDDHKRGGAPEDPKKSIGGTLFGILVCLTIGYFAFIGVTSRN